MKLEFCVPDHGCCEEMMNHKTAGLVTAGFIVALSCSAPAGQGEWDLAESTKTNAETQGDQQMGGQGDADGDGAQANTESTPQSDDSDDEELEPVDPIDCSDQAAPDFSEEDFAFAMYQTVACERDLAENIVFSPAAIRLALGEWASDEVEDDEIERLVEQLGYDDLDAMLDETEALRDELTERRPVPFERYSSSDELRQWGYEEDDPERLREALGIEMYDDDGEANEGCRWTAHNDRFGDHDHLDDATAGELGESTVETMGLVMRGQWEQSKGVNVGRISDMTFSGVSEETEEPNVVRGSYDNMVEHDGVQMLEWRLIGSETTVLLVGSDTRSIEEIESVLFSQPLSDWVDTFEGPSSWHVEGDVGIPVFDIAATIEEVRIGSVEVPATSTTRMTISHEAVDGPGPS